MHNYFSAWYQSAGIATEHIPLAKRWEAIEAFAVDGDGATSLTQVFYGLAPSDPSFEQKFRVAFNKADPNFQMSGNDRELLVLAGAALVAVMDNGAQELADLAGLCLVCAAVQNVRAAPAVPEIPEIAVKYLSKRSAGRVEPEEDGAASKLSAALTEKGEPYDVLASEFQKLQLQFPIIAEESNMLWWLFSETSRDLDERWSRLPLGAVCLVTARELAVLTKVIPGPVAARAFLDRAIRSGRSTVKASISITDVINETPKNWRDANYQKPLPNELNGILPINQSVRLSVEASDDSAWRSMFKTSTGISASAKTAPDKIAYQIFLEHLTARSFAAVKS
jgi:hypothetical protein